MATHKKNRVLLTDDEVQYLKKVIKKKETNQTIAARCRILLEVDENHPPAKTYAECASYVCVSRSTIANAIKLYAAGGIEEVLKIKRNINSDNARRKLDGRMEAKIIEFACSPAPKGHSRWTLRLLEKALKLEVENAVSKDTIRRALKKTKFDLT